MVLAKSNYALEEAENIRIGLEPTPVEPRRFVVLIVRIVVTRLGLQEFIPGPKHRRSVREKQKATEVLDLLFAQGQHLRRYAVISFPTAVPTVILVHAVVIAVAVGPVVLLLVRHQV